MKKIYILLVTLISVSFAQAQTASAVVFAELGEKFTLYLNGEIQNNTPQSNVKISGLTGEFYQARIDFADASLADFANGNFAVQKGVEATYVIKKNKKGEYVLRFHSQAEIDGTSVSSAEPVDQGTRRIAAVDDTESEAPAQNVTMNTGISVDDDEMVGGASTTVTQTTTTKTSPAAKSKNGESVNVGMNVGGVNMGINVNVTGDDMSLDMDEEESHTVTTTTTTSRTTTTGSQTVAKPAPAPVAAPAQVSAGRCASSMTSASFGSAKSNISSKSFEDSKLTVAKQVTKANCMTAEQIKEVMMLFSFEETKIDYAKYAYDFCYNQGDYYVVNEAFNFESSIEDLNEFLESK